MTSIEPGDSVLCTDAFGREFPTVARSKPFLNRSYVGRGVEPWMVVAVDLKGYRFPMNWPLEDVRPA